MRNGGTREVYLTFIVISYDNGKTQTNYCGCMQRNGFQTNNTSDNVRHSAVKYLYAEGFAVYYGGRHQKETSQNRLLLTPEKSLTLKLYRSPTNNSDGIFSVSFSVRLSFGSRSVLVRLSFGSRSILVHPSFILRSAIEDRSKNDRRNIGESSEARRRCIETLMGNQGKGDSNKNFF